jgi:DNA-binding protein H-NS
MSAEVGTEAGMNKKINLHAMSVDEMWELHEQIGRVLSARLTSEKRELEKRLEQLRRENEMHVASTEALGTRRERRKYPRVYPKYRNPNEPFETWSGRGKQPRWLAAALKSGHKIEEFMITNADADRDGARRRRV